MKRNDLLRMCLQNLMRRKSRTFLTVLGVLIGCCSIVIMVSLGIGMKETQERLLSEMGDLTIITVNAPQGGRGKLKLDDPLIKRLRSLSGVEAVTPKPVSYTHLDVYKRQVFSLCATLKFAKVCVFRKVGVSPFFGI